MMSSQPLPELTATGSLKAAIDVLATSFKSLDDAEHCALAANIAVPLQENAEWAAFRAVVAATVRRRGYAVLRGLEIDGGRTLLVVSTILGTTFATYGPGRLVKRFRMSPWTTELSHTLRPGDFHTDGNVSATPPVATAMQCECADPGGTDYAEQRVAHLPELLAHLADDGPEGAAALAFLTEIEAPMAHEWSSMIWRGRLVQAGLVRYHPQSLRVANNRLGGSPKPLEAVIATIHRAAMAVSMPFHTRPGDLLLVSNTDALHYRGACSVLFTRFPTEFESRSLLVLHRQGAEG